MWVAGGGGGGWGGGAVIFQYSNREFPLLLN